MHMWIDCVVVPWKNTKAPGVVSILILDTHHVHIMGNIVNCIQSLRIEVIHIPAGFTYLCQPVDLGINKTLKTAMREKWDDWMIDGDGLVNGVAKEPSRIMVVESVWEIYNNIEGQTVRNAWIKKGYKWF